MKIISAIALMFFLFVPIIGLIADKGAFDPAEKVYLHTNQPFYVSGDVIEFSAIVISYIDFKPSQTSEVLYVSLWNTEKELILKKKIDLKEGFGAGFIDVPKNLSTGDYVIMANTSWMLNFREVQYSKKVIKIVNLNTGDKKVEDPAFSINFFPEGGQIIGGHLNQIAFQTNNSSKKVSGVLVNELSDTVGIFPEYENRYGKFSFFANDTSNYEVLIKHNKDTLKYQLGKAKNDAVAIKVIDNNKDTLTVFANIGTNYAGKRLELLIQSKGKIILGTEQMITGNRLKFLIPKALLGSGLNQLVILNEENMALSERLYYMDTPKELNASIELSENVFKPNDKVVLPLIIEENTNQQRKLSVSVSVRNTAYFGKDDLNPVDFSINLFSDIASQPLSKNFLQQLRDPQFMDIYLMTRKMETFSLSRRNTESVSNETSFIIEKGQNLFVSGRVKDKLTNTYIQDSVIFCSVMSESPQLLAAKTNEEGYFMFELRPFAENAEVILKLKGVDESKDNILYELDQNLPGLEDDDFSNLVQPSIDSIKLNNYIKFKKENLIVNRIYNPEPVKNKNDKLEALNEGLFLNYNYQRDFTEYITLNDFREMVRELIPGIVIKREYPYAKIYLKEYDRKNNYLIDPFPREPLMLIDGMPVFDSRLILNLSPEKTKMVSLINSRVFINGLIFDGILEITTVDGDFHQNLKSNHLKYTLEGFNEKTNKIEKNKHSERHNMDRIPDFKSILYWNPIIEMKTNVEKQIEFQASDDIGEYLVEIKGVDMEGNVVDFQQIIEVKK